MNAKEFRSSRCAFLSAGAACSATFWIPRGVKGYSAAEVRARAVGDEVKPGL